MGRALAWCCCGNRRWDGRVFHRIIVHQRFTHRMSSIIKRQHRAGRAIDGNGADECWIASTQQRDKRRLKGGSPNGRIPKGPTVIGHMRCRKANHAAIRRQNRRTDPARANINPKSMRGCHDAVRA